MLVFCMRNFKIIPIAGHVMAWIVGTKLFIICLISLLLSCMLYYGAKHVRQYYAQRSKVPLSQATSEDLHFIIKSAIHPVELGDVLV